MAADRSDAEALVAWVAGVLPLGGLGFAQTDVDEIGASRPLGPPTISRAEELFRGLITELNRRQSDTGGLLTVPLSPALHLDTCEPSMDDVMTSSWTRLQVPGLYIIEHGFFDRWDPVEQYIKPIRWDANIPRPTAAYYRCWRLNDTVPEYERCLYLRTL